MSQNNFFEFLLHQKVYCPHLPEYTPKWFGWLFAHRTDTPPEILARFKQAWNLSFLCKIAALCDVYVRLAIWLFKMEFNPLPDLLNTGFKIIKIGLFYGGEHRKLTFFRFLTIYHWQDGGVYLIEEPSCLADV